MADDNYKSGYYGADIDQAVSLAKNALPKSGGVMTGALTLNGNPTVDLHAATKQYVDNVAKGAVYIPGMNGRCAYNLLDNSYFVNPINQRGETSYTVNGKYTIDRWVIQNSGTVITVGNGGVQVGTTSTAKYLYQRVYLTEGTTYTLAACTTDGTLCVASFVYTKSTGWKWIVEKSTAGKLRIGAASSPDYEHAFIAVSNGTDSTAYTKWVALYEGEYTEETLPPYVYKGYAVELAECQRYFQRLNASKSAWRFYNAAIRSTSVVTLPAIPISPMRANSPAVSFASGETIRLLSAPGGNTVYGVNNTAITSVFEVDYSQGDSLITIQLNVTNTGSQGNMASAMIGTNGAGYIDLSLDL